jgi:2Fe-2S ferredoxin
MATIKVVFENGEAERVLEFDPAQTPFQHDGKPGSILDVLLGHGAHLEHACGGNCACTTCHVVVKRGRDNLSEATEQEEDLLDKASGLTATSRLGCQAVVQDSSAEIVVLVPRFTINHVSEDVHAISDGVNYMSATTEFGAVFNNEHRAIRDAADTARSHTRAVARP